MNTENEQWGNIELPGLSDEELLNKDWLKTSRNLEMWKSQEFRDKRQKALMAVVSTKEWKEKQLINNQKMRTDEWNHKHLAIMQELYMSEQWKEAVKIANSNPVRNKKIAKAHSRRIQTPDGIFNSMKDAAAYYNLTTEGIRYRCNTDPNWIILDPLKISNEKRNKQALNSSKNAEKRKLSMAKNKGFIFTPYGIFTTLRDAWKEEKKHKDYVSNVPFSWFKKACENEPTKYKKISFEEYTILTGKDL